MVIEDDQGIKICWLLMVEKEGCVLGKSETVKDDVG